VIIKSITAQGFMSFKEKTSFSFDKLEVYIVSGQNGVGKSNFFVEALAWGLLGQTYKDIKVKDIISDSVGKGYVLIETDKGNIKRIRDKTKSRLYFNGKETTQEKLNSLLKISPDLIFNSTIFGQGMCGFFLLKDTEKKKLITKINLGYIDERIQRLVKYQNDLLERNEDLEQDIYNLKDRLEHENKLFLTLKKQSREQFSNKENFEEQLLTAKKSMLFYNKKMEELKELCSNSNKKLDRATSELKVIEDKRSYYEEKISACSTKTENIESKLKILDEKICPTCYGDINKETVNRVKGLFEPKLKKISNKLKRINILFNKIKSNYESIYKIYEKILDRVRKNENEYSDTKDNYLERKSKYIALKGMTNFESSVTSKNILREYKHNIISLNSKIDDYISKFNYIKKKLEACDYWLLKLKEFRSDILNKILEYFIPTANHYLSVLSDGMLQMSMKTVLKGKKKLLDKFDIILYYWNKKIDYKRLSGGQLKQASTASNMAFAILINKFFASDINLIIFDEIFDQLDQAVRGRVLKLLCELKDEIQKTIIVIGHEPVTYEQNVKSIKIIMQHKTGSKLLTEN